jgi:hypothetical protein
MSERGNTWSQFHFATRAQQAFAFVREYGYELSEANDTQVLWRSRKAEVTVRRDPRSYELEVHVRPRALTPAGALRAIKGDGAIPFSLADIAAWRAAPEALSHMSVVVENPDTLPESLAQLATWLRQLADPLLRGSSRDFWALDRSVAIRSKRVTKEFSQRAP